MHVHVGFGNPDSRIRVMTALRRHLPLLHALSTSSPFHSGSETGLKSWRLNLLGVLPHTSVLGPLGLQEDYRRIEVIKDDSSANACSRVFRQRGIFGRDEIFVVC